MNRVLQGLAVSLALVGCTPEFEDTPWRVDEPRVLAIVSEPPEARPNEVVQLSALIVSPDGVVNATPAWSVCTRPRTSAERTAVTQRCLEGQSLEPVSASMSLLGDACARFGPNVPPAEGDAPPQRPSDPDPSGGYFLPVHAEGPDAAAFGAVRIRCDLPGVTRRIFDAFEARYTANVNPSIAAITLRADEDHVLSPDSIPTVSAGADVEFDVTLAPEAAEPYVRYDAAIGELVDDREWLRVQWLVTDGVLERGQEVLRPSAETHVAVSWVAPATHGQVHGWVVVTDARGGSAWRSFTVEVR